MSQSQPSIYCPNPACANPENLLSHKFCDSCQTQLIYRYLWASGPLAAQMPQTGLISDRYYVIAPQIWLDTRPGMSAYAPDELPDRILPYLRLYPQRLHIPEVYGFCQMGEALPPLEILLLENVPVDPRGSLYPDLIEAWPTASPVRQVYWLWQMLELWQPLAETGVASSLLVAENIRVEGWRVWLRELYLEGQGNQQESSPIPSLQQLGHSWASWFPQAQADVAEGLSEIYQQMQLGEMPKSAIASALNQLLLAQSSKLQLRLRVAGSSDIGPQNTQNEDSCYPAAADLPSGFAQPNNDPLLPVLSIVCDGIGGHEGGEVASQLAVASIKLQIKAMLAEVAQQEEILPPDLVAEQLEAAIRVVNNLIAARNDQQGRSSRQRMGTTLVMALQLPQQVQKSAVISNAHELYIAHIGDSRAYWITSQYCQQLTVDDDVATREVRAGRSLYRQALKRQDAGALTQAMGTRDSSFLRPTVQRLILEEDGLLLLCSDGLCDRNLIENSWTDYAEPVLQGRMSVDTAVRSWIDLANQKNGHDNISAVLTYCRVSTEYPVLFNLMDLVKGEAAAQLEYPVAEPAGAMLHQESSTPRGAKSKLKISLPLGVWVRGLATGLGLVGLVIGGGAIALLGLWLVNPKGVERMGDKLLRHTPLERLLKPGQPPVLPGGKK